MILLGSFISTSQSEVISTNTSGSDLEMESGGELLNSEKFKVEVDPQDGVLQRMKNPNYKK